MHGAAWTRTKRRLCRKLSVGQQVKTLHQPPSLYNFISFNLFSPNFIAYAAPEIVSGHEYDPMKSDIWSLGVILFIILNAIMPFDDNNMGKLLRDQKQRRYCIREEIVGKLSHDCKSLLHDLLEPNPKFRMSINKVYEAKWIQKHVQRNS